jgi:hypothetical protein
MSHPWQCGKMRAGVQCHLLRNSRKILKKKKKRFVVISFNIKHQYIALRTLRQGMTENEAMIHVDFSENYQRKYGREIQNVQVTLHTCVFYYKDTCTGFCTISDFNKHGPPAIWVHVNPFCPCYPDITTAYFVSDGPTTQYRYKAIFLLLLFSTLLFDWGFKVHVGNWSFLEAGHGKGPADLWYWWIGEAGSRCLCL